MHEVIGVLAVLVYGLAILTTSFAPIRSGLSQFELKRRTQQKIAKTIDIQREAWYEDILAWQRIASNVLLAVAVLLLIRFAGWPSAILVAILAAVLLVPVSNYVRKWSRVRILYRKIEPFLFRFGDRYGARIRFLRDTLDQNKASHHADSREEMINIINKSAHVLSDVEQKLLIGGLSFSEMKVEDVMTPRRGIVSISHDELLGPLVLDDLHATGYSHFPVMHEDIDSIIGVLRLQDVTNLRQKKSVTAEKTMHAPVQYINNRQTLEHALLDFLRTQQALLVVVDESHKTVGVVMLTDVVEVLLGRRMAEV